MPPPADVRDIAQAQAREQPVPNLGRAVSHLVSNSSCMADGMTPFATELPAVR
jgi:hypothetical protein